MVVKPYHIANKYKGVVLDIRGNNLVVELPFGRRLVKAKPDINIGMSVCLLMDTKEQHVVDIISEQAAINAIRCGSDPAYDNDNFEPAYESECADITKGDLEDYGYNNEDDTGFSTLGDETGPEWDIYDHEEYELDGELCSPGRIRCESDD